MGALKKGLTSTVAAFGVAATALTGPLTGNAQANEPVLASIPVKASPSGVFNTKSSGALDFSDSQNDVPLVRAAGNLSRERQCVVIIALGDEEKAAKVESYAISTLKPAVEQELQNLVDYELLENRPEVLVVAYDENPDGSNLIGFFVNGVPYVNDENVHSFGPSGALNEVRSLSNRMAASLQLSSSERDSQPDLALNSD